MELKRNEGETQNKKKPSCNKKQIWKKTNFKGIYNVVN